MKNIRLVTGDDGSPAPPQEEGIFEELDAAEGQLELKVRDPYGDRIALLQFRTGAVDEELLIALEAWYERRYVLSRRSPLHVYPPDPAAPPRSP